MPLRRAGKPARDAGVWPGSCARAWSKRSTPSSSTPSRPASTRTSRACLPAILTAGSGRVEEAGVVADRRRLLRTYLDRVAVQDSSVSGTASLLRRRQHKKLVSRLLRRERRHGRLRSANSIRFGAQHRVSPKPLKGKFVRRRQRPERPRDASRSLGRLVLVQVRTQESRFRRVDQAATSGSMSAAKSIALAHIRDAIRVVELIRAQVAETLFQTISRLRR
jgi:hypothetical protein